MEPAISPAPSEPAGPGSLPARAGERAPSEERRRRRLAPAVIAGYGAVCAVGAIDLLTGAVLLAVVVAVASVRAVSRNPYVAAAVCVATVAARFYPPFALALAFATVAFLLARAVFLLRNLRVVCLGLLAYAVAVGCFFFATPSARRLLAAPAAPGVLSGLEPVWVGAPLALAAGCLFMALALALAGRGGYAPARALEVMSVLPMVIGGMIVPFATGALAAARLPELAAEAGVVGACARAGAWLEAAFASLRALHGGG